MAHVTDLWQKTVTGADGRPAKIRTPLYGKGLRYRARYKDPGGREHSKSFPDGMKQEALNYTATAAADVLRGTWEDPKTRRVTLAEFTEKVWLPMQGGVPATRIRVRSQVRKHILPVLGSRELPDLARHPSVIQSWIAGLKLAPSTAGVTAGILSGILQAAVADSIISRNPFRDGSVRLPRADDRELVPWAAAVIAAIRAELPDRYQAMTECGADLGLRQGETVGLAVDAVDFLRRQVRVERQVRTVAGHLIVSLPKGRKTRTVPLPESTALVLAAHIAAYPPAVVRLPWAEAGGDLTEVRLLFTRPTGKAVRASDFDEDHWKPAVKAAGQPGTRADGYHMLRHTFASDLIAAGVDVVTVAGYLGHAKATTTLEIYGHLVPGTEDRMRKIIDARAGAASTRHDLGEDGSGAGQA